MATAASLEGIKDNGPRWKGTARIDLPKDIPDLFEECETNTDVILLGHRIVTAVNNSLKQYKSAFPKKGLSYLEEWMQEADETFVWDHIESVEEWADDELADGLEDELIYRLNGLYDWADYWRVCFVPVGN